MQKMSNMTKIQRVWCVIFLCFFLWVPLHFMGTSFVIFFLFLFLLLKMVGRPDRRYFIWGLFGAAFLLRVLVCIKLEPPILSDFQTLLEASVRFADGDWSFNVDEYFKLWPYQIGFVFVQGLFLKILNSVFFLKLINCLVTAGICVLIYQISQNFVKETYARTVAVLYAVLPFPVTYVTVLSNQHLATFLIYFAIYILVSKNAERKETGRYVVAGGMIAVSNVIRPEGIVPVFAIVLFLLLTVSRQKIKKTIINMLAVSGSYFVLFALIGNLFIATGLSPEGLTNPAPHWKFVCGLNYESSGMYAKSDVWLQEGGREEEAREIIKERILDAPEKISELFMDKMEIFWMDPSFEWTLECLPDDNAQEKGEESQEDPVLEWLEDYETYTRLTIYILVVAGVFFSMLMRQKYNDKILIFINLVFITFGVYLLIEIQTRYVYFIQIATFILAGPGIQTLEKMYKKYIAQLADKKGERKHENTSSIYRDPLL